jgi:hypothetical protein
MGWWAYFRERIMRDPFLSRAYIEDGNPIYTCSRLTSWTYEFDPDAPDDTINELSWDILKEPRFFCIVDVFTEEKCHYLHLYVGSRMQRAFPHEYQSRPW